MREGPRRVWAGLNEGPTIHRDKDLDTMKIVTYIPYAVVGVVAVDDSPKA